MSSGNSAGWKEFEITYEGRGIKLKGAINVVNRASTVIKLRACSWVE